MSTMSDTPPEFEAVVAERYRRMSSDERMKIASSMFETARALVESSLPPALSRQERRLAIARRLYGGELPEAALAAHARWGEPGIVREPRAYESAREPEIDLSLIEASLSYSYEKRVLQHQAALELALEVEAAGRRLRGAAS